MRDTTLSTLSPLMQLITWKDQEYYTSQYFHQQYTTHSQYAGKYRRFDSFMRLLRSIPAYRLYVEQGAIMEMHWAAVKKDEPHICGSFQPLFQAAGWNPIVLLSATAQTALTNFLDDTLSQQMAVAANTAIARQYSRKTDQLLPMERAVRELEAGLGAAKLLGTPLHIAQQEVVKMVATRSGVNFQSLLLPAPAQNMVATDEKMLEPTDLAKTLGLASGVALNRALEALGWQVKRIGGGWEATPTGAPYAAEHAWTSEHGHKHGYNLRWRVQAVTTALQQAGVVSLSPQTQETPTHA